MKDLMVASDLQWELVREIASILPDFSVFRQLLPVLKNDDDDPDQFFPYVIVRLSDGVTNDDLDLWTVTVDILVGVYDEDLNNTGHDRVMIALERITTRFCQEATLGEPRYKAYRCMPEIVWALQDTDTYPYYFGSIQLKFQMPKAGRRIPDGCI